MYKWIPVQPIQIGLLLLCLVNVSVSALAEEGIQARVLTLPETISLAMRQNLALQRAGLGLELGANSLEAAKAERNPNLTLSASGSTALTGDGQDSIFEGGGDFSDSLRASLSAGVTLYDGGAIKADIEAARADLEAVQNEYDRNRQALLLEAVSAYLEAMVREKQVRIREEELANQQEQLDRIRLDFENGIRVRSEVLRQEAEVARSRGNLIEAKRLHAVSLYALKDLLQIPANTQIGCADPGEAWDEADTIPAPDLTASLRRLDNRLDLEAQRARLASSRYSIKAAQSGRSLSVTAAASLSSGYSSGWSGDFSNQFLRTEPAASAGVSLNLPIFDRRRTETNVLRQQLLLRQEELLYESLLQVAHSDLYRAILNFESAQAQLESARNQLASAEEALQAETARYEAGVATLLDVNSLRSTRLDAAVSVEQARFDLFTSRLSVSFEDGSIEAFLLERLSNLDPSTLFPTR